MQLTKPPIDICPKVPQLTQHRHLSAKERRDLKKSGCKGNKLEIDSPSNLVDIEEDKSNHVTEVKMPDAVAQQEQPVAVDCANDEVEELSEADEEEAKENKEQMSQSTENAPQCPLKRGQRNKLKKIRTKYKDQDDEEREMMMAILKV